MANLGAEVDGAVGVAMVPCARCSRHLPAASCMMSGAGPVCDGCHEAYEPPISTVKSDAYLVVTTLGLGALSVFFNPCLLASIFAIINSLKSLGMYKNPDVARMYGDRLGVLRGCAIAGVVLGCVHPALMVGVLLYLLVVRYAG
jgi:hypothetical protein